MRKSLFVVGLVCLMGTSIVFARNNDRVRARRGLAKSGADLGLVQRQVSAFQPLLGTSGTSGLQTSDGAPHLFRTPGTTLVQARTEADGSLICDAIPTGGVDVFNVSIHTGEATEAVLVDYVGQIDTFDVNTSGYQAVLFTCAVTQGGIAVPCSATKESPALVGRAIEADSGFSTYSYTLDMLSYSGYALVAPNTDTEVKITLTASTGTAQACWQNLRVGF